MNISLIAAIGKNRVIGIDNTIPWKLSNDLLWFKQHTLNKPIIMGRITYESIKRPLINRINIVLTHSHKINKKKIIWVNSMEQAIDAAGNTKEIMIIGGEKIYKLFLPYANKLYLTYVDIKINGDSFFPVYTHYKWKIIYNKYYTINKKNSHNYSNKILERCNEYY